MNMTQGEFLRAILNMSRTREAPTPAKISKNSDPDTEKKGTPASPAIALASSVFPAAQCARGVLGPLLAAAGVRTAESACSAKGKQCEKVLVQALAREGPLQHDTREQS